MLKLTKTSNAVTVQKVIVLPWLVIRLSKVGRELLNVTPNHVSLLLLPRSRLLLQVWPVRQNGNVPYG